MSEKQKDKQPVQDLNTIDNVSQVPETTFKSGAEVMVDTLQKNGVEVCWGYPGGSILPFYDVLYRSSLKHFLVRHEQGAAFAAQGYARVTGKLGVAVATSGPGATNLLTGIADAKIDSIPILSITGQVPTSAIGTDAFQEADIYGMSIPITKYNALLKNPDDVALVTQQAITVSQCRRQGPTLIDFPKDIQVGKTNITEAKEFNIPEFHYKKPEIRGDIQKMVKAINRSSRPLLYVGGGAISSEASANILQLAEKARIPVITTLMGIGAFPGNHELSLGMVGMHGTAYANKAVMECDFILALGARFDDRVAGVASDFASTAIKGQIDIDPAEIDKRVHVELHIEGDLNDVLEKIVPQIAEVGQSSWEDRIHEYKKNHPMRFNLNDDEIKPQYVLHRLWKKTAGEAVVVTDVGQHQMWAAQFYPPKNPRSFVTSAGLGTMGFGLPAALGAKVGVPNRDVFLITGDGSFQMNIQELGTARAYDIDVRIILFHNRSLGMVRQWQQLFYDRRYAHSIIGSPDFVKVAEAYGIPAKRIEKPDELEEGLAFLTENTEHKGVRLLEVIIPDEENVFPMIAAGAKYQDMIEYDHSREKGSAETVVPHHPHDISKEENK